MTKRQQLTAEEKSRSYAKYYDFEMAPTLEDLRNKIWNPRWIELRSRFWIGYQILGGNPVRVVPDRVSVPEMVVKGLFAHNLKEFSHLATILPCVCAEEKDKGEKSE
jgi:hypothetical protein